MNYELSTAQGANLHALANIFATHEAPRLQQLLFVHLYNGVYNKELYAQPLTALNKGRKKADHYTAADRPTPQCYEAIEQVVLAQNYTVADIIRNQTKSTPRRIELVPPEVQQLIDKNAAIYVSVSAGKDSQALLYCVMRWYEAQSLTNPIYAIHADLGDVEWAGTLEHIQNLCTELGVPIEVVQRERNGKPITMIDRWRERKDQLQGQNKPFWSSSAARYCTSDMKVKPINKVFRTHKYSISVEGIRWQESKARSEKPRWRWRDGVNTVKGRKSISWNAIIDFTVDDVWATYGQTDKTLQQARAQYLYDATIPEWWNFHAAYAMGNSRLSCALCVLQDNADFENGIRHNPELADTISAMEEESGWSFRQGKTVKKTRAKMKILKCLKYAKALEDSL